MDHDQPLQLLWIGFRTLRSLEEGCLQRKRVTTQTVSSFEAGAEVLAQKTADIVVLSVSATGPRLRDQIQRARALAPEALIAVVVCNDVDAQYARDVGADDVTALEHEGELVCAPVLRWVDMRRRGNTGLIDLRAATRRRRGLESEVATLHAEVSSLSRQAVRDPASGVLGRGAFVLQLELAAELLTRMSRQLHLFVFELSELGQGQTNWGDFVVGGIATRVGQTLSEVAGDRSIIGRIGPSRFAVALTDATDDDASWLLDIARNRLGEIAVPSGGEPHVLAAASRLHLTQMVRPGLRLLEQLELEISDEGDQTRIMRRHG